MNLPDVGCSILCQYREAGQSLLIGCLNVQTCQVQRFSILSIESVFIFFVLVCLMPLKVAGGRNQVAPVVDAGAE